MLKSALQGERFETDKEMTRNVRNAQLPELGFLYIYVSWVISVGVTYKVYECLKLIISTALLQFSFGDTHTNRGHGPLWLHPCNRRGLMMYAICVGLGGSSWYF